jgi:FkbM family methyltransferase
MSKLMVVDFGDSQVNVRPSPEYKSFWDGINNKNWENNTLRVISEVLKEGGTYIDIGAWIGPTVLKAAKHAEKIIAYEPDPIAWEELQENVKINNFKHIELRNVALFDNKGEMNFGGGRSGTLGMSVSTLMSGERGIKVVVRDIKEEIQSGDFIDAKLIKIDTEGAEYTLIPHIRDFLVNRQPSLILSCHSRRISGDLGFWGRINHIKKRKVIVKILYAYKHKFVEINHRWISLTSLQAAKFLLSPRKNYEFFVCTDDHIARSI